MSRLQQALALTHRPSTETQKNVRALLQGGAAMAVSFLMLGAIVRGEGMVAEHDAQAHWNAIWSAAREGGDTGPGFRAADSTVWFSNNVALSAVEDARAALLGSPEGGRIGPPTYGKLLDDLRQATAELASPIDATATPMSAFGKELLVKRIGVARLVGTLGREVEERAAANGQQELAIAASAAVQASNVAMADPRLVHPPTQRAAF